jgi:hypothetical protein
MVKKVPGTLISNCKLDLTYETLVLARAASTSSVLVMSVAANRQLSPAG